MRRKPAGKLLYIIIVLIAAAAVLQRGVRLPVREMPPADRHPSRVEVLRVIDGDTFVISDNRSVRLLSIDAPEAGQPVYDESRSRLAELLALGQVRLEYEQTQIDQHGRLLCHVYVEGKHGEIYVNELLVREGLANVYLVRPNTARAAELIEAQRAARTKSLGIWNFPPPAPESHYLSSKTGYIFHRPSCRHMERLPLNRQDRHSSRDHFLDKGYSPCRTCGP